MRIQSIARARQAKKRAALRRKEKALREGGLAVKVYAEDEVSAAATLQRVHRGKKARARCGRIAKELDRLDDPYEYDEDHAKAATAIQAGHRGKNGRKRVGEIKAKKAS